MAWRRSEENAIIIPESGAVFPARPPGASGAMLAHRPRVENAHHIPDSSVAFPVRPPVVNACPFQSPTRCWCGLPCVGELRTRAPFPSPAGCYLRPSRQVPRWFCSAPSIAPGYDLPTTDHTRPISPFLRHVDRRASLSSGQHSGVCCFIFSHVLTAALLFSVVATHHPPAPRSF